MPRRVLLVLLVLLSSFARAQSVRTMSSPRARVVAATKAAEEQGALWPDVREGAIGTQLHLFNNFRNADAILVTSEPNMEAIVAKGRKIAQELGAPGTDFLTFDGTLYRALDLEFNDTLAIRGDQSRFVMDLDRLLAAVERAGFPKPIVVAAKAPRSGTLTVGARPVVGTLFLRSDQAARGTVWRYEQQRPWWSWIAAVGLCTLLLLGLGSPLLIVAKLFRRAPKPVEPIEPVLATPEEVQKGYDASGGFKAFKVFLPLLPLLLLVPLLTIVKVEPVLEAAFTILPVPEPRSFVLFFGIPALTFLIAMPYLQKRAKLRDPALTPEKIEDGALYDPTGHLKWLLLPSLAMMFMIAALPSLRPLLRRYDPTVVRTVIFSVPVLGTLGAVYAMWRSSRNADVALAPGDPVYDEAHELAARAGVRFRRAILRRSEAPNGFVTLGGTIGATTRLAREFPRDELRAILAHEIGHLRHRHVVRSFLFGLLFLAAWIGLRVGLDDIVRAAWPEWAYRLWATPIWGFLALPILSSLILGIGSRKREFEADRFAAEIVSDPEIVIRALVRIHHLSGTPGRLRPSDEALSTHPSLARRIAALRSLAPPAL